MRKDYKNNIIILISLPAVYLLIVALYIGSNYYKAAKYGSIVNKELLTLDIDIWWPEKGDSATVDFWVHNKSEEQVNGIFTFEVSLHYTEIGTKYLQRKNMTPDWAKGIRKWMDRFNVESPKAQAILNFIDRGNRLQDTLTIESCQIRSGDDSLYVFCLIRKLNLHRGQLQKVSFFQELNGYEIGFEYTARIKGIKPDGFLSW